MLFLFARAFVALLYSLFFIFIFVFCRFKNVYRRVWKRERGAAFLLVTMLLISPYRAISFFSDCNECQFRGCRLYVHSLAYYRYRISRARPWVNIKYVQSQLCVTKFSDRSDKSKGIPIGMWSEQLRLSVSIIRVSKDHRASLLTLSPLSSHQAYHLVADQTSAL